VIEAINTLNEPQRQAVLNTLGPSLVIAGAGSGKTRVLTFRIAHLIDTGVKPANILSLTFTNKAASEMQERIRAMVGEEAKHLWMGTFHSVFSRILRLEHEKTGYTTNYTIYDTSDCKSLLKKIAKDLGLDKDKYTANEMLSKISRAKNSLITPVAYERSSQLIEYDISKGLGEMHRVYKLYAERCRKADAMDFDDLLLNTNMLFRDHTDVLEKYQDRFKYVLVDEYQDTNQAQYLIIKKLCSKNLNLCVVGDDAQSIYSFRGAKVENILNFQADYPKHKIFKLEQNYRSTQTIVEAANSVIRKNKTQLPKVTFSENDLGHKIKLIKALTDTEEGAIVSQLIARRISREGLSYRDFAILYRTNVQSRIFEECLHKLDIPCKIFGGTAFFQRAEIKNLLAYIRLCINSRDEEALYRIINYPSRAIGEVTVTKLQGLAEKLEMSSWELIQNTDKLSGMFSPAVLQKFDKFNELISRLSQGVFNLDAYTFAEKLAAETGIISELRKGKDAETAQQMENTQELLNAIKEFSDSEPGAGITRYMEKVALLSDTEDDKSLSANRVTLMTIHSAKGLEFKHIFVVGMEENLFPSGMSLGSEKDIEEERRLFYVAITRAELTATLTFSTSRRKYGKMNMNAPSRFIYEIDPSYISFPDSMSLDAPRDVFTGFEPPEELPVKGNRAISSWGTLKGPLKTEAKKISSFKGDDTAALQTGMRILHEKFGEGKVLKIENTAGERKASVFFENGGSKLLLLKYAKLKILK
jgi:DNA helicase II / ATP-dependent DNA helicase PcrA